jgi:hypothetical protein
MAKQKAKDIKNQAGINLVFVPKELEESIQKTPYALLPCPRPLFALFMCSVLALLGLALVSFR